MPERQPGEEARLAVLLREQDDGLADAVEVVGKDLPLEGLDHQRVAALVGEEALGEVAEAVESLTRWYVHRHVVARVAGWKLKTRVESRPADWFDKWRGRIGEARVRVEGRAHRWKPPPRQSLSGLQRRK